jgi:anthranilate phosphoribosyltransferase
MTEEHPFANYIRILGKGRKGARALTQDEAYEAMKQIYCYDVEPEQLGAFLMLMRVKEETAEEVAGFVRAIRESIPLPANRAHVAIDWSSYAGKRRQLPWYLLAALTLGRSGYPGFMHGMSREDERVYTRQALEALDMEEVRTFRQASAAIEAEGFAYMDIANLSLLTAQLIEQRLLLGLRPPLHTVARMLNPYDAPLMLQGVFHPNYAETHQRAAQLLGQPKALAFKGEGGEIERIPERAVNLYGLSDGELWQEQWPALLPADKYVMESFPDWDHFRAVWQGDIQDHYGEQAVIGTLTLALRGLGEILDPEQGLNRARELWDKRHMHTSPAPQQLSM